MSKMYASVKQGVQYYEVGERTCVAKVSFTVSRFDNGAKDPQERDVSPVKLDDLEIDIQEVRVYDDELGKQIGSYERSEIPDAEEKYWTKHIESAVSRYITNSADYQFDWVNEGEI